MKCPIPAPFCDFCFDSFRFDARITLNSTWLSSVCWRTLPNIKLKFPTRFHPQPPQRHPACFDPQLEPTFTIKIKQQTLTVFFFFVYGNWKSCKSNWTTTMTTTAQPKKDCDNNNNENQNVKIWQRRKSERWLSTKICSTRSNWCPGPRTSDHCGQCCVCNIFSHLAPHFTRRPKNTRKTNNIQTMADNNQTWRQSRNETRMNPGGNGLPEKTANNVWTHGLLNGKSPNQKISLSFVLKLSGGAGSRYWNTWTLFANPQKLVHELRPCVCGEWGAAHRTVSTTFVL